MAVATNFAMMDAMLKAASFQVPESMRGPELTQSSQATQETRGESVETTVAIDNLAAVQAQSQEPTQNANTFSMEGIATAIDNQAKQADERVLAASAEGAQDAAAALADAEDRAAAALVAKTDKFEKFDTQVNKMLGLKGNMPAIEGLSAEMPKFEVAQCDQTTIACNLGGGKERTRDAGMGTPA